MYTFTPGQRRRKDYFPSLIYYFANPDSIKMYEKLDKEEEEKSEEEEEEKQLEDVCSIYFTHFHYNYFLI
jgi:hypothetical protein